MSAFSQCLNVALKLRHMSQKALADRLGKTTVYINRLYKGTQLPSMDLFFEICDALSLSPAEFFSCVEDTSALRLSPSEAALMQNFRRLTDAQRAVTGDMLAALAQRHRPRPLTARPRAARPRAARPNAATRYASRAVSGYAAAGLPLFDRAGDTRIDVPAKYQDDTFYMLCTARGDSMQPEIMDGDVVVVERGTQAESGMIALVHIESPTSSDGEYAIKRFYPFADHAELRSINPAHPTLIYPAAAILTAERVVHIIHRNA